MCGIAGFLSFSSNYTNNTLERIIKTQTNALSHRGPDAEGSQRATKAMLEMKKIDLAAMKKAYLNN